MDWRFPLVRKKRYTAHRWQGIEVFVGKVQQLFNSMDPSRFCEKDLDSKAEEFMVSRLQKFARMRFEVRTGDATG